jgi:hypothetical protein
MWYKFLHIQKFEEGFNEGNKKVGSKANVKMQAL